MKGHHAAVTGIGLVTPAGIGTERTWDGISSGRSSASPDPELKDLPVDFSCRVPDFDEDEEFGAQAPNLDRCAQLGLLAAREAVAEARLDTSGVDPSRIGVVLGSAMGGLRTWETQRDRFQHSGHRAVSPFAVPMFLPNMVAGQIAIEQGFHGPNLGTVTACAAGATAIGTALDLLRADRCDIVVAGGTEAPLTRLCVTAFARTRALSRRTDAPHGASRPFDRDRDGFVLAEGAGVLVLERVTDAGARAAPVRGRIIGYGASGDGHHATAPHPEGRGAEQALRSALRDAGAGPGDVDHVNAHGTSTRPNDSIESEVIHRVCGHRPPVTSAKGAIGHALGAAGAVEAALTVLTTERNVVPPTANLDRTDPGMEIDTVRGAARPHRTGLALSNSFGFGGHNAVLAVAGT
ncbi:beta-ketoacyl-[acyl-carrier-protein] synthase family protein [Streptomyces daliensis]|uniref:Beta-ketoacyl-[acyl-carrier-protein] synthase family protein n=1 Tax=Streptomyces daliensis TaxID=299421 RepID=A0A8T4IRI0_9ACTN|nr:beta-ketoacyl-[acyl-carrier-protein] synthase family protein [Streptomyces daliensis]